MITNRFIFIVWTNNKAKMLVKLYQLKAVNLNSELEERQFDTKGNKPLTAPTKATRCSLGNGWRSQQPHVQGVCLSKILENKLIKDSTTVQELNWHLEEKLLQAPKI